MYDVWMVKVSQFQCQPLGHDRTLTEPIQKIALDDLSSGTGLASKFLADLQRFIACKKLSDQEHLVDSKLGAEFKTVVGQSRAFTPRTNLMFRSNSSLRTAFE